MLYSISPKHLEKYYKCFGEVLQKAYNIIEHVEQPLKRTLHQLQLIKLVDMQSVFFHYTKL